MATKMTRRITRPTSGVIRPKTAKPVTPKAGGVSRRVAGTAPKITTPGFKPGTTNRKTY